MPLFKLPFEEYREISVPLVGQAQPAEVLATSTVGVVAGGAVTGGGVAGTLCVTGGEVGAGVATGVFVLAGAVETGADDTVCTGLREVVATVLELLPPKLIFWPTWMTYGGEIPL